MPRTSSSQRGVYVVLVPFVLIALFGLIGLTLTSGYAFTDRSKLQNLLDAMALAGAAQVNMMNARALPNQQDKCAAPPVSPPTGVLGVRRAVLNVLLYTAATPGNEALGAAIAEEDVIIQYATSLSSGAFSTACPQTDSSQPIYVRIRLRQPIDTPIGFSDFLMGIIQPWLVDERYDLRISGSAVAGPAAAAPVWGDRFFPVPLFVCDQSASGPIAGCGSGVEGSDCSYGYVKRADCELSSDPVGTTVCDGIVRQAQNRSLPVAAGFTWLQSMAGVLGAYPNYPTADGRMSLVELNVQAQLSEALRSRRENVPWMVVPVLSCGGEAGFSEPLIGYLCVELKGEAEAVTLRVVDSGSRQGLCGAGPIIGRVDSRPPQDGRLPPLWRIVLYKTPGAGDS
ncbi:TadE/TadG family type IV pilus assembly protein [Methylolobus aquaticus]